MAKAVSVSRVAENGASYGRLHTTMLLIIILLIVQFVIGMALNLFAVFPPGSLGNSAEEELVQGVLQTGPGLAIHVINGLAILALSATALYFSLKTRSERFVTLATLGIAFVMLGLIGGVDFVISDFQNDFDSFLMAIGFVFAISSYFVEFNLSSRGSFRLEQTRQETA